MKKVFLKSMLLLCALIVGSMNVWATDPEVTLDFTNAGSDWSIPTSGTNTSRASFTNGGYTIYLYATNNYKANSGYLILGKKDSYLELPAFSFDVDKIEVLGHSGASASVKQNIYVESTAVSTETTGADGATNSYTIASGYQAAGTIYKLVITSAHNTQIDYIKIYQKTSGGGGGSTTVSTPTFDPVGGTYTSVQNVALLCGIDGATIRYTMTEDGSTPDDPTESDATYSSKISVTKSGTKIKAKAFKADMTASSVATATYTIKPNKPTVSAAGARVTISGDDGLTFYYTTNNSAPTNSSTEYTGSFDLDADCTIKAIAYDANNNASDVTSFKYKYMPLAPKNIGSGYYVKVTDVSDLENGDAILIVNEGGEVAMSTTQNSANRGKEDIEFLSSGVVYNPSANVQKIVLVKKTEKISDVDTEVFYFYTGSGYLYASSSSSNQLKTETTPDDNNNARATITISNGDATITFKGSATRNLLKYNSTNNPPIFSCYNSGQTAVQIYREVAHNESVAIGATGWATFSSSFALDFAEKGVNAYVIKSVDENKVNLTQVTKVPANTGLLINGTTDNIPVINSASATDDVSGNKLVPGTGESVSAAANKYVLAKQGGVLGFYVIGTAVAVPTGKAYLDLGASGAPSVIFIEDEENNATNIETIESSDKVVKFIENGKLLIRKDGVVYDALGRVIR